MSRAQEDRNRKWIVRGHERGTIGRSRILGNMSRTLEDRYGALKDRSGQ